MREGRSAPGFPSLFCFNFFGWLRRRKRAAKKIIATAGRLAGGSFRRQIENPPQHGKRLKRKIPQRQGRLAGDFRARLGRLIVRTALPCRRSSDALNMAISSGSIFFSSLHGMGFSRELIYSRSRSALKLGSGRFQRNTESPPSTSGFSVWKDACFCSPPTRRGRGGFFRRKRPHKENAHSCGVGWRK